MPAIAEKIYANLMKDPDLYIPEGLTRDEFARKEADARERQHRNNAEALSLFKEEIEYTILNYNNSDMQKKYFYKHGIKGDIYNSLPQEAQNKIDELYKRSQDPDFFGNKFGSIISQMFENFKNILEKNTDVDFGNFEATDEIKK